MFGRFRGDQRRFRAIEDAIVDLAADVSSLRMQLATIRGKTAVAARETKKQRVLTAEDALIEQMTGGTIVANYDPATGKTTMVGAEDHQDPEGVQNGHQPR